MWHFWPLNFRVFILNEFNSKGKKEMQCLLRFIIFLFRYTVIARVFLYHQMLKSHQICQVHIWFGWPFFPHYEHLYSYWSRNLRSQLIRYLTEVIKVTKRFLETFVQLFSEIIGIIRGKFSGHKKISKMYVNLVMKLESSKW